jgi:hypothetical protein
MQQQAYPAGMSETHAIYRFFNTSQGELGGHHVCDLTHGRAKRIRTRSLQASAPFRKPGDDRHSLPRSRFNKCRVLREPPGFVRRGCRTSANTQYCPTGQRKSSPRMRCRIRRRRTLFHGIRVQAGLHVRRTLSGRLRPADGPARFNHYAGNGQKHARHSRHIGTSRATIELRIPTSPWGRIPCKSTRRAAAAPAVSFNGCTRATSSAAEGGHLNAAQTPLLLLSKPF